MFRIVRKMEDVLKQPSIQAEHQNVLVCDIMDGEQKEFEVVLHKSEIELIEMMNHLQKHIQLAPTTMNDLWSKIEAYGRAKAKL